MYIDLNDPYKSIQSHFRRKWSFVQMSKLGNPFEVRKTECTDFTHFMDLTRHYGHDIFGIKYQFDNWIDYHNKNLPILFLDFNEIVDNRDLIDIFIGKQLNWDRFKVGKRTRYTADKCIEIYSELYDYIKKKSKERNISLSII